MSASAVSVTRSATFAMSSRWRRSRSWRLVTILAFASGERRRVHLEIHGERRLVYFQQRQRFRLVRLRDRHADADFFDAVDEHDVAGLRFVDDDAFEAFEHLDLVHFRVDRRDLVSGPMHDVHQLARP